MKQSMFFLGGQKSRYPLIKEKVLVTSVLLAGLLTMSYAQEAGAREYREINGQGNNFTHPQLGRAGEFLRKELSPDARREPGGRIYNRLKSAREISNILADQRGRHTCNSKGLSDMFWVWGQFLDHDITLVQTSARNGEPAPANIPVPANDRHFPPGSEIAFDRSHAVREFQGRRFQANSITSFIDASNVYGSDEETAHSLRVGRGGLLEMSAGNLLPVDRNGSFLAGDVRANENGALTAMHTLWAREHNRIARALSFHHPRWNDEQLYQEARRWVIAEMQAITYNEFLPRLLGEGAIFPYWGYQPNYIPEIISGFSTAAYRFGHSMLSPNLLLRTRTSRQLLPLRNAFFNPGSIRTHGIEAFLFGASTQMAQELDPLIVDDVRNFLFGRPGAGGFDLAALNIQRGRDHALPGYNQSRRMMGLSAVSSFDSSIFRDEFKPLLKRAYSNPNQADLWITGLAEKPVPGSLVGPSFQRLLVYQFESLRAGDRLWYERDFSDGEVRYLNSLRLSVIIDRNTDISPPANVMDASEGCQPRTTANTSGSTPRIQGRSLSVPAAAPQNTEQDDERMEEIKQAIMRGYLG